VHCGSEYVFSRTGSEKLEGYCTECFPRHALAARPRYRTRHQDFERTLNALNQGNSTSWSDTDDRQSHDIHGVTLVGWWAPILHSACPISAPPNALPVLTQVAGRPVAATLGQSRGASLFSGSLRRPIRCPPDFTGFYEKELRFRSWMHYPPYSSLANVLVRSDKLNEALLVVRHPGELV